jgi:hypothetical protein
MLSLKLLSFNNSSNMFQYKKVHKRKEVFQVCKVVLTKKNPLSIIDVLSKAFLFITNFDPKYVKLI